MRVAIVGAGLMGRWHAHAARRAGARVACVVDTDLGRAQALASRYPGASTGRDAGAILHPGQIDAVHICSPLPSHASLARAAVAAGVHALVEKPLAVGAPETQDLFDAARKAGVVLCPVHQVAFQDGVARARAALGGHLGAPARITFDICSAGGGTGDPAALDAVVADILPHPFSLLRALWPDAPLEPSCWSVHRPGPGELLIAGVHAGAALCIGVSLGARPTRFAMTADCRAGAVELDLFHGFAVLRNGEVSRLRKATRPFTDATGSFAAAAVNLGRRALAREPAYPGLTKLVRAFYAAVASGRPAPISPEDAVVVAEARDAVLARTPAMAPPGLSPRAAGAARVLATRRHRDNAMLDRRTG